MLDHVFGGDVAHDGDQAAVQQPALYPGPFTWVHLIAIVQRFAMVTLNVWCFAYFGTDTLKAECVAHF